ncbi:MAG: phage tail family protein [Coriobacteriia bacterium]|nr:phage tail family protein [Coriobacteriia bacterium]
MKDKMRIEITTASKYAPEGRILLSEGPGGDYILIEEPGGLDSPDSELCSQEHALLDGGSVSGGRAKMRRLWFKFVMPHGDPHAVSSLFPLGRLETITVMRGGQVRYIRGYRDGPISIVASRSACTPEVLVSFLCPSAYFTNDVRIRHVFMGLEGGLRFPSVFPVRFGALYSGNKLRCHNAGDHPAGFELNLRSSKTGSVGIEVGEYFATLVGLNEGDFVTLDTVGKMLVINGRKCFDQLEGSFPLIAVGGADVVLHHFDGEAQIAYSEIYEGA